MKLHLPKMLAVALLSACAVISANAAVPYTGTVYTWDNTTSGTDSAFGKYALTTYDEQGTPTVTSTVISGKAGAWGDVQAIFASDNIQTGNTLRFDSTHGQDVKTLNYGFTPFTVGGIIVEEGASGFSIQATGSNNRAFFLGNKDGSASYNKINEDFAINKTNGKLTLTLRGAETFDVAEGKTFTLKSNNPFAMSGSLNVTGKGTTDFAQGNVEMASGFTLTVQEGAALKFAGEVSGLSRTITNDGIITFNGVALSDSLNGFEASGSHVDYNGDPSTNGNGYAGALDYTIIKGNTDTLTQVTWKNETKTLNEGVMHVDAEVDYTTYRMNTDGTTLNLAIEKTNNGQLNTVILATGTKLNANDDFDGTVSGTGTATVEIAEDKVLSGTVSGVALTGKGIYALASGTQTLGSVNTTGFEGYVRLSGNIANIDLDGNLGSANVEFKGLSGHFKNLTEGENATYVGNILLTAFDASTPALKITNGYSRTESEYIFTGDISGDGTWELNCSGITQHYVFAGNLDEWCGEFKVTNSGANNGGTSLTFRENAKVVEASISRLGGTLKLFVENEATFYEDVTGITSLTVSDGNKATFADLTVVSIGSLIGAGDVAAYGDLTLTGTTTDTAEGSTNFTGSLELLNNATLTVTGNVDLGGHLNAGDHTVTVEGSGSSLTLTEGSALGSKAIENSGSVTLIGLDVSEMKSHEGEEAHFNLEGHVTGNDNYYVGVTGDYVQVVNGGTSAGTGLKWNDLTDLELVNGRIIVGDDKVTYTTYYVGGETSTSIIAAGAHAEDLQTIEVLENAKLSVDDETMTAYIHANDGATVAGEYAQAVTQIAGNSTVAYEDGLQADRGKVQFSGDVQVTNYGATDHTFSVTNTNMVVKADAITMSEGADDHIQIACWVDVGTITNESGKLLYLEHLVSSDLVSVSALSGEIMLISTQGDLTVQNLEIGAYQGVQVVKIEGETAPEATVTVTEALTGGSGRLFANLTFTDVDLQDGINPLFNVNGGGDNALTLGSTFGITDGTIVSLDAETINALANLANGQSLDLIRAYDQTPLSYLGEYNNMSFDQLFARTEGLEGDYVVYATEESFGLKKTAGVPEPTTGTLSLLALVALAARRRRK